MPSKPHHTLRRQSLATVLALLLTGILLVSLAGSAAPAQAAPHSQDSSGPSFIFFQRLKAEICAYSQAAAHFELVGEGGGVVPFASASATAAKGTASVDYNVQTGEGVVSYKAPAEGSDSVTIIAGTSWGKATRVFNITVIPCDYRVSIQATSFTSNEFARLYQTLTGEGHFNLSNGSPVGNGTAKYNMVLWGANAAVVCDLQPEINVSSSFTIQEPGAPLASLTDSILLSFVFTPFQIPETKLVCKSIQDNIKIKPLPMPGGPLDPSSHFSSMAFPSEGGEYEFEWAHGTGYVNVIRLLKE